MVKQKTAEALSGRTEAGESRWKDGRISLKDKWCQDRPKKRVSHVCVVLSKPERQRHLSDVSDP